MKRNASVDFKFYTFMIHLSTLSYKNWDPKQLSKTYRQPTSNKLRLNTKNGVLGATIIKQKKQNKNGNKVVQF